MELPHSSPPPPSQPAVADPSPPVSFPMEIPHVSDEVSTAWEWRSLLDFTVDDQLLVSWDSDTHPIAPVPEIVAEPPSNSGSDSAADRIRKRDPRLTCSNFLAGRIPCSCPEEDEKDEEEEAAVGNNKRTRTYAVGTARCQVPGCEADISELKGYHRRHRVCLRCANSTSVILDGLSKRYCQQCGKFHILSDFDEGKRSCRRKLERHNKRRRRKGAVEKESQEDLPAEDISGDGEADKDSLGLSNQVMGREVSLEAEGGHTSPPCSAPSSQNIQTDSGVSNVVSGETNMDGGKDGSKCVISSSFCDIKSSYSSMCPTGRISFKLYDWNPAEFPRRLRHQIFQWLASMPVELEGYIRPGCTILTIFIAMPQFMWEKLSEDAASYVCNLFSAPESLLSGRGTILLHLNNMIFEVLKDGTSLMNVKVEVQAPKLHFVNPIFVETGKPMEFVVCGSNLHQPKLRFLVSFAGKYLAHDCCVANLDGKSEAHSCDHQMYKIYIPHTEPAYLGPAFIEVENESGLSNFIPLLLGDTETCSEMQMVQQMFEESLCSKRHQVAVTDAVSESCEVFALKQAAMSELILDIGWLLKEPKSENFQGVLTSTDIQRLNCLLDFLIKNEFTTILEKILQSQRTMIHKEVFNSIDGIDDANMRLFHKSMNHAREIIHRKYQHAGDSVPHPGNSKKNAFDQSYNGNYMFSIFPNSNQDMGTKEENMGTPTATDFRESTLFEPLVNADVDWNVKCQSHRMNVRVWKPSGYISPTTVMTPRSFVLFVAAVVMCFGICAVLLHPHKVGEFAISIRRCVFSNHER
ncbi:squamosa promoter-binding-like protein 7 [Telopea speciosissima]|uniref:squamosa promoter-binding-like protein 7 n=1 Tax=Telopea speciosissima TaxID=54955 RepID=UPI001CC7C4A6|nr:squamosa promoter-binding-like protein 7 [Telopea speciosissima]